jgi:hypothetical protein
MITPGHRTEPRTARPPGRGLAATALALGLASVPALVACGLGLLLAVAGIVTGIMALARTRTLSGTGGAGIAGLRAMAVAGVLVSIFTLLAGGWLLAKAAECGDESRYPDEHSRRICVEREFPFAADHP